MKVLLLNATDIEGGAARAAFRLHQGLQGIEVESQLLVQRKLSDSSKVMTLQNQLEAELAKVRWRLDRLPMQMYRGRTQEAYSLGWLPETIGSKVAQINPDLINLHWLGEGFVKIETIGQFNKPLVWTFHDMWAFTGGCHYASECQRYLESCGACPQLESHKPNDLSNWVWRRKQKAWTNLNLTVVSPSVWLANCIKSSALFKNVRLEVIPHGIDIKKYRPINRQTARELLQLPQDKQLVLFGAMRATSHKRKGFTQLQAALQELSKSGWQDKIELVVFGSSLPEKPPDLGFQQHYLGRLYDDLTLTLVYAAANVIVVPSIQEVFGQTASESMACGTPVVAFRGTGVEDIVSHQETGYLAEPYHIDDLAKGIAWVLENPERYQKLSQRAREKVEQEFTLEIQARRYLSLFSEMVKL